MSSKRVRAIETPCIGVCAVDGSSGYCLGCGRTLKEIGTWSRYSDAERRDIMHALDERMAKLKAAGKLGPTS